jgi:hypothetical protein
MLHGWRDGRLASPSFLAALYDAAPPLARYLSRAVVENSPAAAVLLDEIVARSEGFFAETWPDRFRHGSPRTHDAAVMLVAQSVGTMVLHEFVARHMQLVPWKDLVSPRVGLAQLDVYQAIGEYVTSESGREMRTVVAGLQTAAAAETKERGDA